MTKEQFKAKYESIFADYPDIVNVAQLQKMLGISRHLAYQYLNDGTIQGVIIGYSYVGKAEDGEIIAKIKDGIRYQFQLMRARKPIRTGYILSLCPKYRSEFFSVPENILIRVDPLQVEKKPCDKCQVGYGYDYLITKRTKHIRDNGGGFDVR